MLVQFGRRQVVARRRERIGDRVPGDAGRALASPGGDDRIKTELRGEGDALVDRVDRAARDAGGAQLAEPVGGTAAAELLDKQWLELIAVSRALVVGAEPRILREPRYPQSLAQLAELDVVACRHDELAVSGRQ